MKKSILLNTLFTCVIIISGYHSQAQKIDSTDRWSFRSQTVPLIGFFTKDHSLIQELGISKNSFILNAGFGFESTQLFESTDSSRRLEQLAMTLGMEFPFQTGSFANAKFMYSFPMAKGTDDFQTFTIGLLSGRPDESKLRAMVYAKVINIIHPGGEDWRIVPGFTFVYSFW